MRLLLPVFTSNAAWEHSSALYFEGTSFGNWIAECRGSHVNTDDRDQLNLTACREIEGKLSIEIARLRVPLIFSINVFAATN